MRAAMLSRIPSLVQLVVVELLAVVCLGGGGIAPILDAFGLCGHPPLAPLSLRVFVQLALGLGLMWLTLRPIWRPRLEAVSWSPLRTFGPVSVALPGDPSAARTVVLSSHPSYVLMDLLAGLLPAFLTWASWGDDPAHNPTMHVWHWSLLTWCIVPLARLSCWFGLRRGPDLLEELEQQISPRGAGRQLGWELAAKPVLAFWIIAVCVCLPGLALGMRDARQLEAKTPVLNAETAAAIQAQPGNFRDTRLRLRGQLVGELKQWSGQPGQSKSAGVCLQPASGPQLLVFADVHRLREFEKLVAQSRLRDGDATFTCLARLLDNGGRKIPSSFSKYYDWRPEDFGPAPTGGRMLLYFVDP